MIKSKFIGYETCVEKGSGPRDLVSQSDFVSFTRLRNDSFFVLTPFPRQSVLSVLSLVFHTTSRPL